MTDTLRVTSWREFIGQKRLKERLNVHITAALRQGRMLDHILLFGPPGFGKTSLAQIVAGRMKQDFASYTMPLDERTFIRIIHAFDGVVLLDEIHRASKNEQERMLPLMEFGWLQDKRGRRHQTHTITFIGATTEPEKVIAPLFDRFAIKPHFDDYSDSEMGQIVTFMSGKAGVRLDPGTAQALGGATGGTPRVARQFVLAARDLEVSLGQVPTAEEVLHLCRTDKSGLTEQHLAILRCLKQQDGRAGLKTLQNLLRLNEGTIRELERLLIRQDLLMYTERGRELTGEGFARIEQ